jgi:hypothetical protein
VSFLPDEETARFEVKGNNSTPALFSPSLLGLAERRAGIGKRELGWRGSLSRALQWMASYPWLGCGSRFEHCCEKTSQMCWPLKNS